MRTVAIIQARMTSTRLPGKVLMKLAGLEVLGWVVRAAQAIDGVDEVAVATSVDTSDDAIESWCEGQGAPCSRGPLADVLGRYVLAARETGAERVMRITADCPLLDPDVCARILQLQEDSGADYASNVGERTWPQGLDCEVFTAAALTRADSEAKLPAEREHVTPYLRNHPDIFKAANLGCPMKDVGLERWTLDTPVDYEFLQKIAAKIRPDDVVGYKDVFEILKTIPEPHNRNPKA